MNILITGAYGFLGRHTARKFKQLGYHVTGLGHGKWYADEFNAWGIDHWVESTITFESLMNMNKQFDVIVHCGGSGSVAFSHENPYEDFQKSVQSTLSLLEYIRLQAPDARFIYPSSPAVQGNLPDEPIQEEVVSMPISPYGFHKKIAEELCLSYHKNYGLKIGVIRFFSIYGAGLKKQLLYDACRKIELAGASEIIFFGTGRETRDWINIEDAVSLIHQYSVGVQGWSVINGASGTRTEIQGALQLLLKEFNAPCTIRFNNTVREGDPKFFWANVSKAKHIGWEPKISLSEGIKSYVTFYKKVNR